MVSLIKGRDYICAAYYGKKPFVYTKPPFVRSFVRTALCAGLCGGLKSKENVRKSTENNVKGGGLCARVWRRLVHKGLAEACAQRSGEARAQSFVVFFLDNCFP